MADERTEPQEPGTEEAVAEEQPADRQLAQEDEFDRFADSQARRQAQPYEEPAPELGSLHKDYTIPGVDTKEDNS